MAAHFDFSGLSIERFYHFVCKSDAPTFALMEELGIGDKMRWVNTSMAYYMQGQGRTNGAIRLSLAGVPASEPDREVPLRAADVPDNASARTSTASSI